MADTGYKFGSSVVDLGDFELPWNSISSLLAYDLAYANQTSNYAGHKTGNNAKITGFGFTVPTPSTINGVVLLCHGYASRFDTVHATAVAQLVVGGSLVGSTYNHPFGTGPEIWNPGGLSDSWGLSLSDSDVNASNFGVALSFTIHADGTYVTGYMDDAQLRIYYTEGGGGGYQHKVLGCLPATIAKIMGIPTANIAKFNGV